MMNLSPQNELPNTLSVRRAAKRAAVLLNTLSVREKQCTVSAERRLLAISDDVQNVVATLQCVPDSPKEAEWSNRSAKLLYAVRACPAVRRSILRRATASSEWLLARCDMSLFCELMKSPCGVAERVAAPSLIHPSTPFKQQPWERIRFLLRSHDLKATGEQLLLDMFSCGPERLEEAQAVAFSSALAGRNCFITGAGGCGKSHVVQLIRTALRLAGKNVAVLAPTKLAASRVGGVTYQSWAAFRKREIDLEYVKNPYALMPSTEDTAAAEAVELGLDDDDEFERPIPLNCAFVPVQNKWIQERLANVDTIILDEASMVGDFNFRCLQVAVDYCRAKVSHMRPPVQWILSGDFCQLPCIFRGEDSIEKKALNCGLVKKFLFQSDAWQKLNLVPILLRVNKRSCGNPAFCTALESARLGNADKLLTLLRKYQMQNRTVSPQFCIFAKREPGIAYTNLRFEALSTEEVFFSERLEPGCPLTCKDRPKNLRRTKSICLKIGASMIVTDGPFRDRIGTLESIESSRLVMCTETGERLEVPKFTKKRACKICKHVGSLSHFPVEVKFAFTVHKAQGRSLHKMMVDVVDKFWEPGQAYVAISRAVDPRLLRIENIHNLWFKCANEVKELYARIAAQTNTLVSVQQGFNQ